MLLEGKKFVITGGVTGIGKATALGCAREGASVVTMSRALPTDDRAIRTIEECRKLGSGVFSHITVDVSDRDEVHRAVDQAAALMGGVDCVVNSAALETHGNAAEVDEKELLEVFGININGTIFTNQAAFKHMQAAGGGTIINFSSVAGIDGVVGMTAYTASKGAIIAYSRQLAREWGADSIRVHTLLPAVATELSIRGYNEAPEAMREIYDRNVGEKVLLGNKNGYARLGHPDEVASTVAFLASDMSKFLTGQLIGVDGGMVMGR